jgi:hypothetical protein
MAVPVGSDIEYTDEVTMFKAKEGRREPAGKTHQRDRARKIT